MSSRAARHPIQAVVRRTGLSADVIRAWEKRYDVVAPDRAESGRRLYSDADIVRLQLLARATLSGHTIKQVAALTPTALASLVRADATAHRAAPRATTPAATDSASPADDAQRPLAECLAAVATLDPLALDLALRRAASALGTPRFVDDVAATLWLEVGDRVRAGVLRPSHEQLTLALLRRSLERLADAAGAGARAPWLIVGTPLGQHHELGALFATAVAAAEGWPVLYLGAGLPAETIGETATLLRARAVLLGFGTTAGDRLLPRELRRLRSSLPADVTILAEGAAAQAHRGPLREIGAVVLADPPALRAWLRGQLGRRSSGGGRSRLTR